MLIAQNFKDRYSGSLVGDVHAILTYGGIYSYFPYPKAKIRMYYEWLPLAYIIETLKGVFLPFHPHAQYPPDKLLVASRKPEWS